MIVISEKYCFKNFFDLRRAFLKFELMSLFYAKITNFVIFYGKFSFFFDISKP